MKIPVGLFRARRSLEWLNFWLGLEKLAASERRLEALEPIFNVSILKSFACVCFVRV